MTGLFSVAMTRRERSFTISVCSNLNTALRKAEVPLSHAEIRTYLNDVLVPLWKVYPSASLYGRALDVQDRYRFHFYDSLIVAAALDAGCDRLYSEDLQDGQRVEDLTVENPFR